jgi:protein O-mannosyl-transferase
MEESVDEWMLDGVLDELAQIHKTMNDRQFAFILGAGASVTSGIPTGHHLAQRWLKDLHLRECIDQSPLREWVVSCGIGNGRLTWDTAADHYPQIFERRFQGDREAGYAALEDAMEGKSPSLGYSLLAEIIQHTRHKVVVTTNFDNLVADALAMHAHQSPLVVAHESLAGFVRPQLRRPLVAKIHRDLFLHPINDAAGVSSMAQGWKIALKKLFQYFTPIVVGYGGNDGSLMDMLAELDQDDIVGRMVWCYREGGPPPAKALAALRKHRGLLVKIAGFDEFMLQLAAKLVDAFDVAAIAERTAKLGQDRAKRYREQALNLRESSSRGSAAEQKAGVVLSESVRSASSWWAWEVKAQSTASIDDRNRVYLAGLKQFPKSAELTDSYAIFLLNERKDYDVAEVMFKKALELDPSNAVRSGNYAVFLANERRDYDGAEAMYKRALELDPDGANTRGNYAILLEDQRKDYDGAEAMYKRALELDPNDADHAGNYAHFLATRRKDYDRAEVMYKKSLELDPGHSNNMCNYAIFLANDRKEYDGAESMFKKALELDVCDANLIGNYAHFLVNHRKDYDGAESMFKKALELDVCDANLIGNYAHFLVNHRKDYDDADLMYKKSLELDPSHAYNTFNYADFLANQRRDSDGADAMYKRAIVLAPSDANSTIIYANFLANQRGDYDSAEAMYKKALELAAVDANHFGSYAIFLASHRKESDAAAVMYKKALELAPRDPNNIVNYASALLAQGDQVSLGAALRLVERALDISRPDVSQPVAEGLLYGALIEELETGVVGGAMLARLKGALLVDYLRFPWDFSAVFDAVLPKLPASRRDVFRSLGEAILDIDKLALLDVIESWRDLIGLDPFVEKKVLREKGLQD